MSHETDIITVRQLIQELLSIEDLDRPVGLYVYGHTYSAKNHRFSHGSLSVGRNSKFSDEHVVISSGKESSL